jgi:parallel beta-helix repeat protein
MLALPLAMMLLLSVFSTQALAEDRVTSPPTDGEIAEGTRAAWDTVSVDDTQAKPGPRVLAAAADCLGSPERRVRYTSDGVIHLEGCGQVFTLSEVAAAPSVGPSRLELVDAANKAWFLKVKLKVEEGATLRIIGGPDGDANWLRLRSDATGGIWLRAERGNLTFHNTKVTSWDATSSSVDTDTTVAADGSGGRSYIAARSVLSAGRATKPPTSCEVNDGTQEPYEARMDVVNSEIGYLGYNAAESYGIIWKVYYKVDPANADDTPPPGRQLYAMVDVFGDVSGSTFHHNYFGSYTYGGYCMDWERNLFADNIQYGLDPHDDSDFLTIRENTFRDNGNHGVICSVECNNLVIVNNQSFRNLHGIMIHRNVNGALIEGNTSADNRGAGIAIFDSHDAVVRNNTVLNNAESAIRLSVGSSRNLIESNTLTGLAAESTGNGYVVYTFKGSDLPTSGDGLPKDNLFRANTLTGNKPILIKLGEARNTLFEANVVAGPARAIELKASNGTVVRDTAISGALEFRLDAQSRATLANTQGAIWRTSTGRTTTATHTGSALALSPGVTTAAPLDLHVRPVGDPITVEIKRWENGAREWRETSTQEGQTEHRVGSLQAGTCYSVVVNSQQIGLFTADTNQQIQFTHRHPGGTATFELAGSDCISPVPPSVSPAPVPPTVSPTPLPAPSPTMPFHIFVPMAGR